MENTLSYVYWFAGDAVTKNHKFGGLKQEKCIA